MAAYFQPNYLQSGESQSLAVSPSKNIQRGKYVCCVCRHCLFAVRCSLGLYQIHQPSFFLTLATTPFIPPCFSSSQAKKNKLTLSPSHVPNNFLSFFFLSIALRCRSVNHEALKWCIE